MAFSFVENHMISTKGFRMISNYENSFEWGTREARVDQKAIVGYPSMLCQSLF